VKHPSVPTYRLAPADRNLLVSSSLSLSKSEVFSIFWRWPLGKWKLVIAQWNPCRLGAHNHEQPCRMSSPCWCQAGQSPQLHGKACPSSGFCLCDSRGMPSPKTNPTPLKKKVIKLHTTKGVCIGLFPPPKKPIHRETISGFCSILVSWKFTMNFTFYGMCVNCVFVFFWPGQIL
jgi:hypothetical protein